MRLNKIDSKTLAASMKRSTLPMQVSRNQRRRIRRHGLAPLELVLWIPILLFVAALMVIYGTSAAWRIRGEVAARDSIWRVLTPRTGRHEPRPAEPTWPEAADGATYDFEDAEPLTVLDDPAIQHPVVRGPLGSDWQVTPILDPDAEGMMQGTSSIVRPFPMLARLGSYRSGEIAHPILDRPWTVDWSYRMGVLQWPNEVGGFRPTSLVPDVFRRSVLIYQFPQVDGARSQFEQVVSEAMNLVQGPGLRVLDDDPEIRHYMGSSPDFHPRARIECSEDPERVRDEALEQHVIDWIDSRGNVQLGGITQLPRRLTQFFLSMYRNRIAQIQAAIQNGTATPGMQAELADLEAKVEQLEAYEMRLPEIEDDLRRSSTARP